MNPRAIPFIIPLARKATSANTFTVKTKAWRRGDVVHITHICVCNNTSDTKVAHVGVVRDEHPLYIKTLALTSKTYYYKAILDVLIPTDYRVIVKLITPTSGDMYYINVFGHLVSCGEG